MVELILGVERGGMSKEAELPRGGGQGGALPTL